MTESEWKIFKKIHKKAIEMFCEKAFEEFSEVINNKGEHIHDRYLLLYELVQKRNKKMRYLFDGLSRNKAPLQLMAMRGEGLADEMLLSKLSDEFLQAPTLIGLNGKIHQVRQGAINTEHCVISA